MGLLDQLGGVLKGALGEAEAKALPVVISAVLAKTNLGDLRGLVTKLQQGGLQEQVQSWLGSGQNLPVSADQLRAALGNDQLKQLAQQFGLSTDALLKSLSEHLPMIVDQASPAGVIQAPSTDSGSLADQAGLQDIKG